MEDCCSTGSPKDVTVKAEQQPDKPANRIEVLCPQCGQKGKSVPGQTVKAMLSDSLRLVDTRMYYFCRTESCPVVYFTANLKSIFTTTQLRERVYQKEPAAADGKVCYCFNHRVGEVLTGSPAEVSLIIEDIQAGIAAGQCACDLRNPQGTCCLGNVQKLAHLAEV